MYTLDEQLIVALKKRDFAAAEAALAAGADINGQNIRGETPVFFFAENSSLPMLEWLITHGADLDTPNEEHQTPLFRAVFDNEAKAVDMLLNAGADVDIPNKRKISPLLQSVLLHKDNGVFERLMQAMPNLDAESEAKTTALIAAASHNKLKYVAALLDAGADPESVEQLGMGLLHAAVLSFEPEMLRLVIDKAPNLDPNYAARSGTTPMSSTLGMPQMTEMLLDIGGDPNAKVVNKMYEGMTLLMSVLQRQPNDLPKKEGVENNQGGASLELVQKMLDQGADVTVRTDNGTNSGYHAVAVGSMATLPLLIAKGLDPKRPISAEALLPYDVLVYTKGVDLDAPEALDLVREWHNLGFPFERPEWDEEIDGNWTAAHDDAFKPMNTVLASFLHANFVSGIKEALSLGANVNEVGMTGGNLAHGMVQINYDGMSQQFKQNLAKALKSKKLDDATKQQQIDEIKAEAKLALDDLLSTVNNSGLDWNLQNKDGKTPLHIAAASNNKDWAKYLLTDRKVNPTLRDKEGLTPAGAALKAGHLDMFTALTQVASSYGYDLRSTAVVDTVQASANDFRERQPWLRAMASVEWTDSEKNQKNADGQTALYVASATEQQDVVRTLVKMGLDPNAADPAGNTPLMQAVFTEDGEIIRLLRAVGGDPNQTNDNKQSAFDVADYVKSVYVHNALKEDTAELAKDLITHPLSEDEKMMAAYANAKIENTVRFFKDESPLEIEVNKYQKQGVVGVTITDPQTQTSQVYGDMSPEPEEGDTLDAAEAALAQAQQKVDALKSAAGRRKGP